MVWFQSKYNHSSQERSILYPPLVMIKAHKIHSSIWVHYRIKNPSEMIEERIPAKIWYIRTTDISILKWTCLIIELNSYPSTTESHTLFSISNVETELMNAHSHTECLCMINPPWMISPYVLNQFGPWKEYQSSWCIANKEPTSLYSCFYPLFQRKDPKVRTCRLGPGMISSSPLW